MGFQKGDKVIADNGTSTYRGVIHAVRQGGYYQVLFHFKIGLIFSTYHESQLTRDEEEESDAV